MISCLLHHWWISRVTHVIRVSHRQKLFFILKFILSNFGDLCVVAKWSASLQVRREDVSLREQGCRSNPATDHFERFFLTSDTDTMEHSYEHQMLTQSLKAYSELFTEFVPQTQELTKCSSLTHEVECTSRGPVFINALRHISSVQTRTACERVQ